MEIKKSLKPSFFAYFLKMEVKKMIDEFLRNVDKKLDVLTKKIDELEQTNEIEILSTADVMRILSINRNTANDLFKQPDFPKIRGIKSNKIEKQAFLKWLRNKNEKE